MIATKQIVATITKSNEQERTISAIVSDATVDRYGEIVKQDWKLDNFKKNPVILFGHDAMQVIGKATRIEVIAGKLHATIKFATTARAEEIYQLFKDGSLRAFSVGFRPTNVKFEKHGDREVAVLTGNELLEISAVAVGANANALAVSVKSAPVRAKRYEDLTTRERHDLAHRDRAAFDALRADHVTRRDTPPVARTGEQWADFSALHLEQIAANDRERFESLRATRTNATKN